jgi:hypothetical protein
MMTVGAKDMPDRATGDAGVFPFATLSQFDDDDPASP